MKRAVFLVLVAVLAVILLYVSRFWFLDLWGRPGLFGSRELPPGGGLVGRWLRGTQFAPFELLIWACGGFLVLTVVQSIIDRLSKAPEEDTHEGRDT